jgi:hypothetical protein
MFPDRSLTLLSRSYNHCFWSTYALSIRDEIYRLYTLSDVGGFPDRFARYETSMDRLRPRESESTCITYTQHLRDTIYSSYSPTLLLSDNGHPS